MMRAQAARGRIFVVLRILRAMLAARIIAVAAIVLVVAHQMRLAEPDGRLQLIGLDLDVYKFRRIARWAPWRTR